MQFVVAVNQVAYHSCQIITSMFLITVPVIQSIHLSFEETSNDKHLSNIYIYILDEPQSYQTLATPQEVMSQQVFCPGFAAGVTQFISSSALCCSATVDVAFSFNI